MTQQLDLTMKIVTYWQTIKPYAVKAWALLCLMWRYLRIAVEFVAPIIGKVLLVILKVFPIFFLAFLDGMMGGQRRTTASQRMYRRHLETNGR